MADEVANLKNLWRQGMLTASEFAKMAAQASAEASQAAEEEEAEEEEAEEEEAEDEEEDLVSEDGVYSHNPRFQRRGNGNVVRSESDSEDAPSSIASATAAMSPPASPNPHNPPTSPLTPMADGGPAVWESGLVVRSSTLKKEVTFLRMGNESDWINKGNAKIQYTRLKKHCSIKVETATTWVDPRTLSLIIPEGEGSTGEGTSEIMTSPRKSPRTIERQTGPRSAPRAAELPELAAHERDRKLPMKKPLATKEVQRRGRQKEACQTKESNVPVEKRIEEFPGHSLAKDPQTGKLRCLACKVNIENIKSTINTHCSMGTEEKPSTHAKKLLKWRTTVSGDAALKEDLVAYFRDHPEEAKGTKDQDALLYR